jgi:flagellar secretion chaperone FliS
MLQQNPYGASAYRAVGIETGVAAADPLGLVIMLYDGAIQAIARAERHLERGEIEARGLYTSKAIDIVTQGLSASLDLRVGGPLAESLASLYEYMGRRLLAANHRGDRSIYAEVSALLLELRVSWVALQTSNRANDLRGVHDVGASPSGAMLRPRGRSIAA